MRMPKKFHGKARKESHKNFNIPSSKEKQVIAVVVYKRRPIWSSVSALLRDYKNIV